MSYALGVAPDAMAALRALDVDAQEAIFDLLDELAREGDQLASGGQSHFVSVWSPPTRTSAILWLVVDRGGRSLQLAVLHAVTGWSP